MNKEEAEKVVKDTIEYANKEIEKNKKRYLRNVIIILATFLVLILAFFMVFKYEMPIKYSKDIVEVNIPEDQGLDIKINLSNYKSANALLVKTGEDTYDLPLPLNDDSYNFSFSGLKSAVINLAHNEKQRGNEIIKENMATSFQNRVVEILVKKTMKALKDNNVHNLIVAGGVAANKGLREGLKKACAEENINLIIPEMKYCTDNAAMIGAAAYYAYQRGDRAGLDLNAKAVCELK